MLPSPLKRLLTLSNGADFTSLEVSETLAKAARFQYKFFGNDSLPKGEVVLVHQTNTYSGFLLTAFGSLPATSPDGVFWQEAWGTALIDFKVNFAEGTKVDSLKGTLTLLDWFSTDDRGRWIACVSSFGREVAITDGTWSRCQL
jgi:hypothetical protein